MDGPREFLETCLRAMFLAKLPNLRNMISMYVWLLFRIYDLVVWRSRRLSALDGFELRSRWALRFAVWSSGGTDDDFSAELFYLAQAAPQILDTLDGQLSGTGHITKQKRLTIRCIRDALDRGLTDPYS